jgi:L-amino acid N-acyltransferase YncA
MRPRAASLGVLQTPGGAIELHYAGPTDAIHLLQFARTLPPEDLFFLRRDITQPEEIDAWMRDDAVLGYSSVSRTPLNWIRHVAELRVVVAPEARGLGLGRALTDAAFKIAMDMGVRKMIAQMTLEQTAAMAVFRRLGFVSEALLPDHVIDATGQTHDLLVMARRVSEPPGEPAPS